jgi:hypothetical protein
VSEAITPANAVEVAKQLLKDDPLWHLRTRLLVSALVTRIRQLEASTTSRRNMRQNDG